ncbi:MAG: XRE family transcriptional regulator [Elusimicrobia bacterium]|nr:XRE family transcriptional regulator [Elusimicrobiota bacterium]
MNNAIKLIAARIKALREITGLTPEKFATEVDIDAQTYQNYETGDTDIPVSALYTIARNHNVDLAALLTGQDPKLDKYFVVKSGDGLNIARREEYSYQDLAHNFIGKKLEVFLVTADPSAKNESGGYAHKGQEFIYILEGALKINFEGKEVVLADGDSIYFNATNKHKMQALGAKIAKFLVVITI